MSGAAGGRRRPRVVDVTILSGEDVRERAASEARAAADEARRKPTSGASIGDRLLAKDPDALLRLAATGGVRAAPR